MNPSRVSPINPYLAEGLKFTWETSSRRTTETVTLFAVPTALIAADLSRDELRMLAEDLRHECSEMIGYRMVFGAYAEAASELREAQTERARTERNLTVLHRTNWYLIAAGERARNVEDLETKYGRALRNLETAQSRENQALSRLHQQFRNSARKSGLHLADQNSRGRGHLRAALTSSGALNKERRPRENVLELRRRAAGRNSRSG
jgi:hypothetical protein